MIGVIADPVDYQAIREFFELFKTPWEFTRPGRRYEVLLCAGGGPVPAQAAGLTIIYCSHLLPCDAAGTIQPAPFESGCRLLLYGDSRIPIYGNGIAFTAEDAFLRDENSGRAVGYWASSDAGAVARIGYDLFAEIRLLLTVGQPDSNAATPALDLHIALLRDLIVKQGVPLLEIPPVPDGYRFIACLTHDADHPSLRLHGLDHTMWGFLYRAVVRSAAEAVRGRLPFGDMLRNWWAAAKLPFIHLGLAEDFWRDLSRYVQVEDGKPSTFFVIPFRGRPGLAPDGVPRPKRAAAYGAADISGEIEKLTAAGCEIGLHGIDAWRDSSAAIVELEEVRRASGGKRAGGVRMHWLYFQEDSPAALESAGASYDSTVGFNETVGFRAGTTQAYRPFGAKTLLELPLHIMDTALFYPAYLTLSQEEARRVASNIVDSAVRLGGCVTVNWHDRSIAPERLWGEAYRRLVGELMDKGAWFGTGENVTAWFRMRRAAFDRAPQSASQVEAAAGSLPGLQVRIYNGPVPAEDMMAAGPIE